MGSDDCPSGGEWEYDNAASNGISLACKQAEPCSADTPASRCAEYGAFASAPIGETRRMIKYIEALPDTSSPPRDTPRAPTSTSKGLSPQPSWPGMRGACRVLHQPRQWHEALAGTATCNQLVGGVLADPNLEQYSATLRRCARNDHLGVGWRRVAESPRHAYPEPKHDLPSIQCKLKSTPRSLGQLSPS